MRDLQKRLPVNKLPLPSGSGFRAWETRRANIFQHACAELELGTADLTELRSAAVVVSESIAARWPDSNLPRGYAITINAGGEPSLALGGVLFAPFYSEPEPDASALARLGADLKIGLLAEIIQFAVVELGAK